MCRTCVVEANLYLLQLNVNAKPDNFGWVHTSQFAMMDDIKRLKDKQASKHKENGKADKYYNLTDFKSLEMFIWTISF